MRRSNLRVGMLFVLVLSGCAKAPPTLGPQGIIDFQTLQIGKDLDVLRDFAQAASKTDPPLIPRDVAVKVTVWHRAAVVTLAARTPDWRNTIKVGLNQALASITPNEKDLLQPYVTLVETVLDALPTPAPTKEPQ